MATDPESARLPLFYTRGRYTSVLRQCINFVGCLAIIPVYSLITGYSSFPLTLDVLISIFVAEYNRYANETRRRRAAPPRASSGSDVAIEKGGSVPAVDCMAAVVGYREDPELFTRALESYKTAESCRFVLVGVDGDQEEDMEMVGVFHKVFPTDAATIHISEPFGEVAMKYFEDLASSDEHTAENFEFWNELTIAHCCRLAREIIADHGLTLSAPGEPTRLCIYQPHLHKKAIMFTSFIFSIVISDMLGIEYLWSSDSDTIVLEQSLRGTIETIAGDRNAGGASSGLVVHNADETYITKLGSAVYWCELYITRSTPASSGTSDCQSGPSTAFRVAALPGILYTWYTQTVLGHRMIINEDRHLTTNLLLRGWTVTYASDSLTTTETPSTFSRWINQQVRWARATHIETLQQPKIYLLHHPIFFWAAFKREAGPLLVLTAVIFYLLTGRNLAYFSYYDVGLRLIYTIIYNFFRNPDRGPKAATLLIVPALLFYNVPLPAIQMWSLVTLWERGWGTSMRSSGEMSKADKMKKKVFDMGFLVVWMGIVGGCVARLAVTIIGWEGARMVWAIGLGVLGPTLITFQGLIIG